MKIAAVVAVIPEEEGEVVFGFVMDRVEGIIAPQLDASQIMLELANVVVVGVVRKDVTRAGMMTVTTMALQSLESIARQSKP